VSSWFMALSTRRTLEHYHPDDGPLDAWLASWAARGMVPEYPWEPTPVVVNSRSVLPYALVDAEWLAEHPEYTAAPREAPQPPSVMEPGVRVLQNPANASRRTGRGSSARTWFAGTSVGRGANARPEPCRCGRAPPQRSSTRPAPPPLDEPVRNTTSDTRSSIPRATAAPVSGGHRGAIERPWPRRPRGRTRPVRTRCHRGPPSR
jgi:hypothetical protein